MELERLPLELKNISFPDALNNLMYWQERHQELKFYQRNERREAKRLIAYWKPRTRLIAEVNNLDLTSTQKEILYGQGKLNKKHVDNRKNLYLPQLSRKRVSQVVGFGVGVLIALAAPLPNFEKTTKPFSSFNPPAAEAAKYSDKPATKHERRLLWAIRQCESNGRYDALSGGEAYGAYQFYELTWELYEPRYSLRGASRKIQDRAALRLLRDQDYRAWMVCGPRAKSLLRHAGWAK